MITFKHSETQKELQQVLNLQSVNLLSSLTKEEAETEGFVTLEHNLELLTELNEPYPHIIALDDDKLIGYALVTTLDKAAHIPLLQNTVDEIQGIKRDSAFLAQSRYFIMGQVCISKDNRGKGVFSGLYQKMKDSMQADFDYIITEIAEHNVRSIKAHEKVGFEIMKTHEENGTFWAVAILDLNK